VPDLLGASPTVSALTVGALIVVLAVVQSLFGVGLLFFGTPTLLLLGLPFDRVLVLLLPCSIVVSALQVATSGGPRLDPFRRRFLIWTPPALPAATAATLLLGSPQGIRALVGVALLATAGTRLVGPARRVLAGVVRRHLRLVLVLLGLLHGASNLGGGVLSVIAGTTFEQKTETRRQIAFCYGVMAGLQLAVVLATTGPPVDARLTVLFPLLAGVTYLLAGQRLFVRTGQRAFDVGLTGMITAFGVLLLAS
jgi:uncharacterized protein